MPLYNIECSNCGHKFKRLAISSSKLEEQLLEWECPECSKLDLHIGIHSLSSLKTGQLAKDLVHKTRFKKRNQKLEKMPEENKQRMKKFMKDYNVKKESL